MWGSQPWNQWALQPSMFNNVPHDEIDWAELAKQWIQMQQSPGEDHPPGIPPSAELYSVQPPLPPAPKPTLISYNHGEHGVKQVDSVPLYPPPAESASGYWHSEWEGRIPGLDERPWAPPPPPPPPPPPLPPDIPAIPPEKKTFDYGHIHDNPALTLQTVDYNHVSEQYPFGQMYAPPPPEPYDQYWSQVAAAPPMMPSFLKKDKLEHYPTEEDSTHLDAAKRKQLPAWIREGLEKMEQERLKRLQKEQEEKEMAEKMSANASTKKGLFESAEYDGSATAMTAKSKFDSDSETEEPSPVELNTESELKVFKYVPPPEEDTRTEEEKRQDLILKVRRMLTEILLFVTNHEIASIAKEVYQKALAKTPARPLAKSSALQSIATGLNSLTGYDSQSDSDMGNNSDIDDSTSEEELEQRIRDKRVKFAAKEKQILADLEEEMSARKEAKRNQDFRENTPIESSKSHQDNAQILAAKPEDSTANYIPGTSDKKMNYVIPGLSGADSLHSDLEHEKSPSDKKSNDRKTSSGKDKSSKSDVRKHTTRRESYSSSESESSSSSTHSSHSKRSHQKENGSKKGSRKHHDTEKSKRLHHSTSPDHRQDKKRKRDSSDSYRKDSSSNFQSKYKAEKKQSKDHHRSDSDESSRSRSSSDEKVSKQKRANSPHNYRSSSYDRHKKRRDSGRNRSHSRSPNSRSRKESRSHKHRDDSRSQTDDKRKSKRSRRSRSPSWTPKRYKRKSRSTSSERGTNIKKSKNRTHNR